MNPRTEFCPNVDCPARGQSNKGNIIIHSRKLERYKCKVCGKTYTATKGTVMYRLRTSMKLVTTVLILLANGCPVQAIEAAYGLDERTVADWQQRAGQHCEKVHQHVVERPREIGQVQGDELRVKQQGKIVWVAMAIQVKTRLWLGGVIAKQRDFALIKSLIEKVRASALCRPMLFCTDGFSAYIRAIQEVFREAVSTGKLGRPHLRPWDNICIAQVVKQYARRHVVGITRRVIQGATDQVQNILEETGSKTINTAYIERLNATFRSRLASLIRRGRALVRQTQTLYHGMYLIGTVYNFCTFHKSLRIPGIIGGHKWLPRTPAMATGITDHCWTVDELLMFRVPPAHWSPSKKRGRPSTLTKSLITQWCN